MKEEQAKKVIFGLIQAVLFIVFVALVVIGQRDAGPKGLMQMLCGLAGLLFQLWLYNRHYR